MARVSNSGLAVEVEGLRELRRDLGRIDKTLSKGVAAGIKDAASIVAQEAQSLAPVGRTGRLKASIRPRVSGARGFVVANAKKKSPKYPSGYNYPRRIEFDKGGRQAFLRPALDNNREEVVKRLEQLLDDIADIWDD